MTSGEEKDEIKVN